MNSNARTGAGCSRLINEQMAGALWVAVLSVFTFRTWAAGEGRRRSDLSFQFAQVIVHIHVSLKEININTMGAKKRVKK